jgi:hypothetical protein
MSGMTETRADATLAVCDADVVIRGEPEHATPRHRWNHARGMWFAFLPRHGEARTRVAGLADGLWRRERRR